MNKHLMVSFVFLGGAILACVGCSSNVLTNGQAATALPAIPVNLQTTATPPTPSASTTTASTQRPSTEAGNSSLPIATQAPAPTATAGNPLEALARVVGSLNAVKSLRARVTTTPALPNTDGQSTLEWAMPDKYHVISVAGEFIRIGNMMYIKLGPNKWTGGALQSMPPMQDPRDQVAQLISSGAASYSGTDVIDGKSMLVFQFNPAAGGTPVAGVVSGKLWIGAADGLPYQEEATLQRGVQTKVVFYDYNAQIEINPPAQ
jgi:hypothetical protein